MQYKNNLQTIDLIINYLKRKLENYEEQKEILKNKLNILKSLNIKDNKELLGDLKGNYEIKYLSKRLKKLIDEREILNQETTNIKNVK